MLLSICSLIPIVTLAKPITREQAEIRVKNYLNELKHKSHSAYQNTNMRMAPVSPAENNTYYIFSRGNGNGFVIASGDDRVIPVIGYTDKGDFDIDKLPPNMRDWLENYEKQINLLIQHPDCDIASNIPSHHEVPPLLTCNWNQGYPYNTECPISLSRNGFCLTGCVATAMAQIMYYHHHNNIKATAKFMPAYNTGEMYVAGIPENSSIDWDNMIDEYTDAFSYAQAKAVAQLMHYCGVSVQMNYSGSASSANSSDVADALQQFFGYYKTAQLITRSNYSESKWDDLIFNDISQGLPVYMSGDNGNDGHAFVCDGFDGAGRYHVNWGWGGYCNGFFLLNNLLPDSQDYGYGYNNNRMAVVGIVPASVMPLDFKDNVTKRLCVSNWDTDGDKELSHDEAAAVKDLGVVFKGTSISSFDEISYFSGLSYIGDNAFEGCTRLSTMTIPNNISSIGANAFHGCSSLRTIMMPDRLECIDNNAFSGCKSVSSIELPGTVRTIGESAFENCSNLTMLTIKSKNPNAITLGENAFGGINMSSAALFVMEGTKSFYETHPQWNSFGIIKEIRSADSDNYEIAQKLQKLLDTAQKRNIYVEREEAVCDNVGSTKEEILQATQSLRKKLGYIVFADEKVRRIVQSLFDLNYDGELTKAELANVKDYDIKGVFKNSDIESFEEFEYFTGLKYLVDSCFYGCRQLKKIKIPGNVEMIIDKAFKNCSSLERVVLPRTLRAIFPEAFGNCNRLTKIYIYSPKLINISWRSSSPLVFENIDLSNVILHVPRGLKESYKNDKEWGKFGVIREMSNARIPDYAPLMLDERVYIYNIGKCKYINKGEAWGTQAIVSDEGLVYKVQRNESMPEGTYYLESANGILFRTEQDKKVGLGNKACFVDGVLSTDAYWNIIPQDDGTYKIQIPQNSKDYVDGEFLGISIIANRSSLVGESNGLYYDWSPDWELDEENTKWAFITENDYNASKEIDEQMKRLGSLIDIALSKNIDILEEEAIYNGSESTQEEIVSAIKSLLEKLHYIDFIDQKTKKVFTDRWDLNFDDELSFEEAASVTDIGQTFQGNTSLVELEELKYFTGLTNIHENAFKGASALQTIYLPKNVTGIGKDAFLYCNNLSYIAIMNENVVVQSIQSYINDNVTVFVPEKIIESYISDEYWSKFKENIRVYTGIPVVSATGSREYGRSTAKIIIVVEGAPIVGNADASCEILKDKTAQVGDYQIKVTLGNISTPNVKIKDGIFTIIPASLIITANNYSRIVGTPNPKFEVTYSGFRNRENEDVLTSKPDVTCDADINSPAGQYEISVSGAEARNYVISYVPGILTIEDPNGIIDVNNESPKADDMMYDLTGRQIKSETHRPGLFIVRGKKVLLK